MKTKIWAHRGASAYAPENTMEAFQLAKDMGADGIEIDVHFSKDGQIVVAHDETIDRVSNGSGQIFQMEYDELLAYDFSNGKKGYKDVRAPLLQDVLAFIKETGMELNIELKTGVIQYEGIEKAVCDEVRAFDVQQQVIYSSFNHYSLLLAREADPDCRIGLLYQEAMIDPYVYANHLRATAVHPYYPTLFVPGTIDGLKKHGVKIHPWTVDDKRAMGFLLVADVDAIITNKPDVLKKLLDDAD